jgi:hypothetical protein
MQRDTTDPGWDAVIRYLDRTLYFNIKL